MKEAVRLILDSLFYIIPKKVLLLFETDFRFIIFFKNR